MKSSFDNKAALPFSVFIFHFVFRLLSIASYRCMNAVFMLEGGNALPFSVLDAKTKFIIGH
jgi:hypothetical protein